MIRIEPMTAEHIEQIHQLEKLCFPEDAWVMSAFKMELENSFSTYIVAWKNGVVLGYAGMHHMLDEAEIVNIAVSPGFRGQKIGNRLMQGLMARALELDITAITLEVRASNSPAINLYQNYGFIPISIRTNYYKKPLEDAIVMQKINSATEADHEKT